MAGGGAGTSTGGGAFGSAVIRGAAGAAGPGVFGPGAPGRSDPAGPGAAGTRAGAVTTIGEAGASSALEVIDIPTAVAAPATNSAAIGIRIVAFTRSSVAAAGHLEVRRG
jgi:hypothetical protein